MHALIADMSCQMNENLLPVLFAQSSSEHENMNMNMNGHFFSFHSLHLTLSLPPSRVHIKLSNHLSKTTWSVPMLWRSLIHQMTLIVQAAACDNYDRNVDGWNIFMIVCTTIRLTWFRFQLSVRVEVWAGAANFRFIYIQFFNLIHWTFHFFMSKAIGWSQFCTLYLRMATMPFQI